MFLLIWCEVYLDVVDGLGHEVAPGILGCFEELLEVGVRVGLLCLFLVLLDLGLFDLVYGAYSGETLVLLD